MKKTVLTFLSLLMIIFSGCSLKHSPYKNNSNGTKIYIIEKEKASDLAYKAVKNIISSNTVGLMHNGMGYFATEGFLDKQTYTVKLIPLQGETENKTIKGFSFDIYSHGTRFFAHSTTTKLLNYTVKLFDETGTGVFVKNVIPRKIEKSQNSKKTGNASLENKLTNLKSLYHNNLITEAEYVKKKNKLLEEY